MLQSESLFRNRRALTFAQNLSTDASVLVLLMIPDSVCIPPTDFYPPELHHIGENYLRIAYCKQPETIEAAGERLLKLKPYIK